MLKDIFGNEVDPDSPMRGPRKKRREIARGYYAPPETGPHGETCGTCKHVARIRLAKVYIKCERMRRSWTGGYGTDIRLKSPACSGWEAKS